MHIYLDHSYETEWAAQQWQWIAASWSGNRYLTIADAIDDADFALVTIADPRLPYDEVMESIKDRTLRSSELREKLFVFDTQDTPLGRFRGIYASLRSSLFSPSRHRTGCYIQSFNEAIVYAPPDRDNVTRYLFSFQGNYTSRVRARLFSRKFPADEVVVERTEPFWDRIGAPEMWDFKSRYAEVMSRSKFILCPRGNGTSSFRLFEAMQSGRVPVIIADPWTPWSNIDWTKFCLRVREKDVDKLYEICKAAEPNWPAMALAARQHWEQWFSHQGLARLIAESVRDIVSTRKSALERLGLDRPIKRTRAYGRQTAVRLLSRVLR